MHRSCRHLYHFFAALGFFFVADPSAGFAVSPDVPHLVFAHYMVCCPRLGHDATVEDFKSEIRDAQTRKLDGFVLNLGSWSKESYYRDITRRMFQAAKELSSGFKLFFSFDGTPPADALVMLSEFGEHPNYFRVNHRPVISSYSGSPKWGFDMAKELNDRGIEPLLILNYQYLSDFPFAKNYITPTAGFLDRLYAENPILDGYFFFALDLGYKPAPTVIPLVAERSRAAGKISMVGISPFYRGLRGNFRVFEGGGFRGMAAQWMAAIQSGVNWVEIVTWNDWGEATYVAPFGEPRDQDLWNYQWGPLLAHVGFLDASAYFIDWFKTGVAPAIQNDRIFYFYRLHKKTAVGIRVPETGEQGRPAGWENLDDCIFFTSFLKKPVSIDVGIGDRHVVFRLEPGVSYHDVDLSEGAITLTVRDQQQLLAQKPLEFPVTTLGQIGNFNYFAGELSLP